MSTSLEEPGCSTSDIGIYKLGTEVGTGYRIYWIQESTNSMPITRHRYIKAAVRSPMQLPASVDGLVVQSPAGFVAERFVANDDMKIHEEHGTPNHTSELRLMQAQEFRSTAHTISPI